MSQQLSGSQAGMTLLPWGTSGNVWGHFWLSQLAGREVVVVLLVSPWQRPRMLLNITGHPPEQELPPDVSSAGVEEPRGV